MQRPHLDLRLFAAALATSALILAGCGTSAGTASEPETGKSTTTAAGDEPATTDGEDDPSTTEPTEDPGTDPSDGPTLDDLEALLPTASDLGSGWTKQRSDGSDDDDGDDPMGDAVDEQCAAISEFEREHGDDGDDENVEVEFANDLDQSVTVGLSADAEEIDGDTLTEMLDAINDCGTISFSDEDSGVDTEITFSAETDSEFGEQGIRVRGDVSLLVPELGQALEFSIYIVNYRVGTVGVSIQGTDGIDSDTLEVNGLDPEGVLLDLAAQMEDAVGSL